MKLTSPEQMTGNNSYKTAANNFSLKSNYNLSDPFRLEWKRSTVHRSDHERAESFGAGLRHDLVSNSWHQTPLSLGA